MQCSHYVAIDVKIFSFFVPCDSQLMLQCNLVKTGCCYCATPHPESCLSTGTKINMQLRYTFAFEWIRHWLPVIPVCVYLHLLFILTMMSGFSFASVVQLMNHSVCRHFVQVLFLEAWIIWGFDWFKKKEKKHTHILSIKLLNTLNSIIVPHRVNHAFWAMF